MAIAYQSETHSTATTNSSTCTVNKPSGVADGDLLVATIIIYNNNTINSVPSGWTLLESNTDLSSFRMYTYYKIASSEPSTWDWGFNAGSDWVYMCARFDGMSPTSTITASNNNYIVNSGVPSWDCGITQPLTDSMLVMIVADISDANTGISGYAVANDNPTWTERIDQAIATSKAIALATAPRSNASATGNASAVLGTNDGTEDSYCILFAINRISVFSSEVSDTISVTDTQNYDIGVFPSDTITTTDEATASKKKWANEDKNSSSWTNQTKN